MSLLNKQFFSIAILFSSLAVPRGLCVVPPLLGDYVSDLHVGEYKRKNNVVLDKNNNRLDYWNDKEDVQVSIDDLIVNYDSVIYISASWSGGYARLYIDRIFISEDSMIEFSPWSASILFKNLPDEETRRRIAVSYGATGLEVPVWVYSQGWYYIDGSGSPWTRPPVPESSTYGAVFSFSALAIGFIRKQKKRKSRSAALTPSAILV